MRVAFKTAKFYPDTGNILAVDLDSEKDGKFDCYELFGKCTELDKEWLKRKTRNSTANEIISLKGELIRLGYTLKIQKSL